ncbi:MAG: branched-chain amino acid ABC transporter permease [Alphaproteobacteria bacterium]|nr:branched-chain amino acid ABC transporter permease [Alphaproteobacteria bacterium]
MPALELLFSGQLLFSALVIGAIYAMIGLGLNLVYGTMRLLNIAHGDLIMLGAYATFWLFTLAELSPIVSLAIAALGAATLGAVAYYGLFRRQLEIPGPVERLEANSLLLFFGLSVVVQNLASLVFTASPRAVPYLDQILDIGGVSMTASRLLALGVSVALCIAVALFLRMNIYGLAIKALIQNREAARIVGVRVERVQAMSFMIGFGVAGLAGALLSMTEQISPFMGFPFTIAAFIVIIMGGLGNLLGGIFAGFLLGFVEIYGVVLTTPNARSIILYGVFVGVLLLRPQGLFGGRRIAR